MPDLDAIPSLRAAGPAAPHDAMVADVMVADVMHDVLAVGRPDSDAALHGALLARLAALGRPARVTILGAGVAGCEYAELLAALGHRVTLVDPQPWPLAALTPPPLAAALVRAWKTLPIMLRLGGTVDAVERGAAGLRVRLADGASVPADVVLAAASAPAAFSFGHVVVNVRTSRCPLALCPPPAGLAGEWQLQTQGGALVARFVDDDGIVRGFGATQPAPALARELLGGLGGSAPAALHGGAFPAPHAAH